MIKIHRGFRRITRGADRDAYYHEVSVKNREHFMILTLTQYNLIYFYALSALLSHSFFSEEGPIFINV